ncbi:MAG TPA: beta-propeller fold lactonase family protein [Kofleriaceae bacterium]|nr:beta-propeller fold lactonase family protein [Kofleriaceae bacterium]
MRHGYAIVVIIAAAACGGGGGGSNGSDGGGGGDGDGGGPDTPVTPRPLFAYVGGYGSQIAVHAVDPESLAFTPLAAAPSAAGPSFLAIDPQHRWLLAAAESADAVESFTIAADGTLTSLGTQPSGGDGPAHVALDASGSWALVANYGGGSARSLPVAADGRLGAFVGVVAPGANAHQVVATASGTLYVPCLGDDRIAILTLSATGMLTSRTPAPAAAFAGPRHLVLRADGAIAWVLNESSSTIRTYRVAGDGSLTPGPSFSTLPSGFSGPNTGAEIAVDPTGQWVLASNRGHNSIAVLRTAADGSLTFVAATPTGGSTPRHFSFVPGGRAIVVANQQSGTITGFRFDPSTGALTPLGELATASSPTFVQIIER